MVIKSPKVIIFTLLHAYLDSRWQFSLPLLQIVACFSTTYRLYGNPCHFCYTYIAVELSRICQLRKLWKSKFFRLYPLRFYFIASLLDSHLNLSLHFFLFRSLYVSIKFFFSYIRFYISITFYVSIFHTFTRLFPHWITSLQLLFWCRMPTFQKHLLRTDQVESIGSDAKEQLTILDQVVN